MSVPALYSLFVLFGGWYIFYAIRKYLVFRVGLHPFEFMSLI